MAFAPSEIFRKENARELGAGRRQFYAGVNGFILFIFYNIGARERRLGTRQALDGFLFIFYCVTVKTI